MQNEQMSTTTKKYRLDTPKGQTQHAYDTTGKEAAEAVVKKLDVPNKSPIEIAWSPPPLGGRREILPANGSDNHDRGIKAEAAVLLRSIAFGRLWLDEVLAATTDDRIAARERCTKRHVINTIPLAFLAPDIIRAVVDARLPRGITARSIAEPELEWSRQWSSLGISPRSPLA
jgi:hypothetical protein